MANAFINGLTNASNYTWTENGAITHKTTRSDLLDMFAMGAAMRNRSDSDVILMFRKAFDENPVYPEFLSTFAIPLDERLNALETAFSDAIPRDVLSFLKILSYNFK